MSGSPLSTPAGPGAPSGHRRASGASARTTVPPQSRRAGPPSARRAAAPPPAGTAGDVVRWAAFSCVLVPVVLVVYGTPLIGALGAALGLAAVTGACRLLLRQAERSVARSAPDRLLPHRGRHGRTGTGAHRGSRRVGRGAHGA